MKFQDNVIQEAMLSGNEDVTSDIHQPHRGSGSGHCLGLYRMCFALLSVLSPSL
jgi:hypothetical protein